MLNPKMNTMKLFRFTCLLLLLLAAGNSRAQIYFKNDNKEPVYLAFARYVTLSSGGYWQTRGWWTVNSGSTVQAFESIGANDSIGYWGMTTLSETKYEGTKRLLVQPFKKFALSGADLEKTASQHPGFEWRKFRLIRLKPGTTTGTIPFKD